MDGPNGQHDITWHSQLERILSDEGERCLCFQWLHSKSEARYTKLNTYLSLPVIVLSTLAGAGSIGSTTLFGGDTQGASIGIGIISLSVATMNTVGGFFGWAKRSEAHRIAALTYGKIYRFILIELALPREERMVPKDMLKVVRDQCDRMHETSPQVPDIIIEEFKKKFGETTPDVKKPEITNGLDPILVNTIGTSTPIQTPSMKLPLIKTSNDESTLSKLQTSSSVRPLSESASGNNRT
jgi:hypothetical protein